MDRRDFVKTLAGTAAAFLTGGSELALAESSVHAVPEQLLATLKEKGGLHAKWRKVFDVLTQVPEQRMKLSADIAKQETWLPAFDIATMLENQRLFNEVTTENDQIVHFKRMSIPLVARTFTKYAGYNLFNVTAMMHPRERVWWYDEKNGFTTNSEEISSHSLLRAVSRHHRPGDVHDLNLRLKWHLDAATQKYKATWHYEDYLDIRAVHNIDAEMEVVDCMADVMAFDLMHWTLSQITYAVLGSKNFIKNSDSVTALVQASDAIHASCGHRGTWAVVGENVAKEFGTVKPENYFGVNKIGEHNGVDIYFNFMLPVNRMVVGYKAQTGSMEDSFSGGLTHGIYIPCAQTPLALDPATHRPRKGLLVRHDFKFREDGGMGYYAVADVDVPWQCTV